MSDETRATLTKAPTLLEHWCSDPNCSKWGGLGGLIFAGILVLLPVYLLVVMVGKWLGY